ncbi:dynein heavy chain domain-containing protein 1-like isoform X3 [Asterias amurensis]|uniref:dynein heavy chain domain-containing protein 1-like isoform X3 n=1 Tax=Asterias amurensis TaxID=7602 RepID=UPI003AB50A44
MSSMEELLSPSTPSQNGQTSNDGPQTPRNTKASSTIDTQSLAEIQQYASLWAADTRGRLDKGLRGEAGFEILEEDVFELMRMMREVFIATLQNQSLAHWQFLQDILDLSVPYTHLIEDRQEIVHYVDRIYFHAQQKAKLLSNLDIMESLSRVFPKYIQLLTTSGGDNRNFRTPTPPAVPLPSSDGNPNDPMLLPNGRHPYTLLRPGEEAPFKPKPLCFNDLREALPAVVMETTKREAVWSEGLGLTAAALNLDLHEKASSESILNQSSTPQETAPSWTVDSALFKEDYAVSEEEEPLPPPEAMTGKEAVELFGKGRHLGKAKFVYLNKAPNRHFRPYDLIAVPKHKANPNEHWIVSCFGIMHKVKGQTSDSMPLYEWHREAVIWSTLTKMPFFKHFLIRKTFKRWLSNKKLQEFCAIRHHIKKNLLQAVPLFGAGLLQVSKLLQELSTVRFIPLDQDRCFTLAEFEHTAKIKQRTGEGILEKFFSYCKLIMERTCEDSFSKLQFCEAQAKKDKALFSKESLFIQRQKKEQREKNLRKAQEETRCLGNFVQLVDKILLCHLLSLARTNICQFVNNTMAAGSNAKREALFAAKLIFNDNNSLILYPSRETFTDSLSAILHEIPSLISNMSHPMESVASGWVGGDNKPPLTTMSPRGALSPRATSNQERSQRAESNPALSVTQKSTATRRSAVTIKSKMTTRTDATSELDLPPLDEDSSSLGSDSPDGASDYGSMDETDFNAEESNTEGGTTLSAPVMSERVERTKSSDHLGVATPDLVLKTDFQVDLQVKGQGMMGQYSPLNQNNLINTLENDVKVLAAMANYHSLLESAIQDINDFCNEHSWLSEIREFILSWKPESVQAWKRAQAYTIETKLGQIRDWTEKVRNVDRSFPTSNGLFQVDCNAIQEDLVPALNSAFKDLLNFAASEGQKFSLAFISEVKMVVEGMKNKDTDIAVFANYAQQYSTYKVKMPELQKEVEYVKSLFEVIRLSYRSLSIDEEKCEEKVWQSWEAFLLQLQDAAEFVNTQTPIQMSYLEDSHEKLNAEALRISTTATSGDYLDPSKNPTRLLTSLKALIEEFQKVQTRMIQCSHYRQKIMGQTFETSQLTTMLSHMKIRLTLWSYLDVSTYNIKDWKQQLFRKMNVTKALDKVTEWQQAAGQLKQQLPLGDQVLSYWYRFLSDFKQDLPLLKKLSSNSLKPRHWKALFLSLGQVYESSHAYTVQELLSFDLSEHSLQINTICNGAAAEFALEQSLIKLRRLWEDKEFKLAKHIPVVKEKKAVLPSSSSKTKRGPKGNPREAATRPLAATMPVITTLPDMFILIGEAELKYMLEDNLVTLQCMLVSPHLADLRTEAEVWCSTLKQVEEILDLWTACQTKWLYLGRVFGDQELREEFQDLASKFDDADLKYQDIMKAVVTDPKVMSVLEKRKGQKGYREIQGDVLRELLASLISTQEEILMDLQSLLSKIRMSCPRLYFLSDEELIDMLCMTRDKRRWIPLVRQIFPGIHDLQFDLPPASKEETGMMQTSFDLQLHANRLRVVAIEGSLGEHVPMTSPLNPKVEPPQWISGLETIMRNSLGSQLTACLETRLGSDRSAPDKILSELALLETTAPSSVKEENQLKDAVKKSYQHWLLRFPTQCVVITEAIMWAKDVRRGLKDGSKDKLKTISDRHQTRLDQYVSILRDNCSRYLASETRTRLQILLGCLINQGLHHRDILNNLLSLPEPSLSSFDWAKTLHYTMEARMMLQAQPVTSDVDQEQDPIHVLDLPSTPRPYQYTSTTGRIFGPCTLHQLGASFAYNYEYQGPDTPMVATPLTDRCQVAMTTALRSFQCGTVEGPEQTGKAETIRDLAKVMGRHLVTFNCAEATNMSVLSRLLSGMVQSGSWVMFNNLHCMTEGLMSVFGQQLTHLCTALRILQSPFSNQYRTRGSSNPHPQRQRRNSLATLHSSCPEEHSEPTRRRVSHYHRKEPKPSASYPAPEVKVKPEPHTIHSIPQRRHSISNGYEVHLKDHYTQPGRAVPLLPDLYAQGPPPQAKDPAPLPTPWTYKPTFLGHVMLNNTLMPASSNFGCFATLNTSSSITQKIPDSIRSMMRPMSMIKPDLRIILQSSLYWRGFIGADALASKLCTFADLFQTQFPKSRECTFGLRTLQSVIKIATIKLYAKKQVYQLPGRSAARNSSVLNSETGSESTLMDSDVPTLEQDEEHREEIAIVFAIQSVLLPALPIPDDARIVRNLLRSVFPWGGMGRPGTTSQEHDPVLVDSIQCQFVADKLQATPQHVSKVLELYDSLKEKQGVILVGPAGSGKTVCRETLSRVLNTLHTTPPTKEEERSIPTKKISTTSSSEGELRRSHTLEKIRRTAGTVGKMSLSWINAATQGVEDVVYPEVNTDVIFPDSLSVQELLGKHDESRHSWRDGIFTRLLRDASISASAAKVLLSEQTEKKNKALLNPPSVIQRWLILDGFLNPAWTESVGMLLKTDCKMMNLDQGEQIPMADSCSILFETPDLSTASPALISRCAIVHCGGEVVYWKSLTESWLSSAKSHWEVPNISDTNVNRSHEPWLCNKSHWDINKNCLQMLTALIEDTFSSTIDFLNHKCQPILSADLPASISSNYRIVDGIQEVSSFLRILSALCDKFLVHEVEGSETDSPAADGRPTPSPITNRPEAGTRDVPGQANPTTRLLSMFTFSFIWGFGGHLHSRYVDAFSRFARETLSRASFDINLPSEGSVYDYKIDPYHGVLVPWGDKSQDRAKTLPSGYTIIPEIERYFGLMDLLLSSNCPVLLTGPSGVGKSALIQNMVHPKHYFLKTNMSPGLSCQSFEDAIVSKLRPRSVAMAAVATGSQQQKSSSSQLFFIDDLNCASVDSKTGTQPCTDVLRQLLVHGGVYDRKRLFFRSLEGANFIAACTPPGVSGVGSGTASYPLSPRLTRLFCVLSLFPLGRDEMDDVHRPNLQGWLEEFPAYSLAHHYELAQALLSATLDLHAAIRSKLSPTPITPHYVFSHHDINRVIQGLYLLSPHTRGRPRHGARRGGGGRPQAAGGRGRSRGRVKGGDSQGVVTAPPMMRTVVRLWCHEATRTYCDRIVSKEDESWFSKQLEDIVEKCFCTGEEKQRVVTPVNVSDCFPTSSLVSDEGEEAGQTPPTNGVFSGLSSAERGSTALTEDGDEQSEMGVASPTPSTHSSAGSTMTEQSILVESGRQPSVIDESKVRQPTPPTTTTHQPYPPRKSSIPKTLTPALKDGQSKRGREGETRLGTEGRRRGVTFQLGTVNESKVERYRGPLLNMDQVRLLGESLSDIVFAKYIVSGNKENERGYAECNETQLFEGLQRCLMQYNNGASEKMELVFFKEAMRHITRLARVFAIPGANALLIGLTYGMARSPLARVAAFTARCKFFDATASHITATNRTTLREKIKKASQVAGLMGKPAVLVVRGEYGDQALQDVCALMSEGSCPDLYTQEELDNISSQMLPGAKATGLRNQRLEMALERFYRKVMLNLHVVVCIDCQGGSVGSLHKWLSRYPAMLTNCCCVDIYRPWSHEALVNVAEQWLRVPTMDTYTRKTYRIPWSSHNMPAQVTAISHAMAYVHRSAMEAVSQAGNKHFKFFSPLTYLEFIDLFKNLASKIAKEEKATVLRYERALDTLNEAFEAMNGYTQELERLTPLRQQAQETAELRLQEVEECKAIFAEARGMCNQDEEDIAKMQEPLQDIKKQTQDELDKVNPVYEAAWHALKSLNSSDLDEIRTYQKPPEAVIKVVNALCLMFREPYDWMSGKSLINRNNFFQDLEFYNKTAIADDIYHKLNILFIQDPSFKPEIVKKASQAASSLCLWVHAVYAYATIHRNMRPKLQQVEEAEGKLHEAQGHLGNKRVKAQDVKGQLEERVKQYKEAMRMVRSLDKGIRTIEGKISRANTLMTSMATQHSTWKGQLDTANSNIKTAPGDALLAAASACYHGPLGQSGRQKLLVDWLARCESGKFVEVEGWRGMSSSTDHGMEESPLPRSSKPGQSPGGNDNKFTNIDMTSGLDTSFDASSGSLSSDVLFAPANSRLSRATQDTDQPSPIYPIAIRDNFTAEAILSSPEEHASWKSNNTIPHDGLAFHNALFMRTCCIGRQRQWPLLIDPDDQVMTWVKLLHDRGVISFHDGLAFDEGIDTPAALSIANINELNEFEDSLSRETPTTKPTSRGTSTDDWDNATDYPGTPRTVTSFGGDTQYTLKNSFNFRDLDVEDDLSISNTFQDDSFLLETLPDDSDILKPAENLWIIPADNPSLEIRLIQGMLLGATIVITHIERKALDQRFSELLKRNVMIGPEGERRVMIGGREFGYQPSFCLYLCTSVPLELTDSGFVPVLIETTSVIDLSISPDGLKSQLLQHIMAVERREYEGQWRSIEGDIHNQEAMLQQADEEILHKTLNLPHSLLEESTMADALTHHQQVTLTTEASLHETHTLAEQLLQRQAPYDTVAQHGTLLYLVIKSMPILHPLYYIPMRTFIEWFKATIIAHKKNRADIGSPEARAVELTNAIMLDTHSKVSLGMFHVHSQLFSFLVAMEKMKAANELTEEEWLCFVGGASGAAGTNQMMSESVSVPDWITPLMWIGCSHLEKEFEIFRGLKESLVKFSNQWREYFQHDPVLLAPVPGASLAHLTFMQKALLWRIMRPDKLSSICHDLTIYQLGSQVSHPTPYSMETVLARCDNHTPVVFILPAAYTQDGSILGGCEGHAFQHPTTSVTQYLQHQGKEASLHIVSMGTDDQLARVLHAMEECSRNGHWLIIDNVHLLEDLKAKDMLQFIQKMVLANKEVRPSESRPQTKLSSKTSRQSSREESESQAAPDPVGEIHEDFRLFLITRADSPNRIPGLLLQHSIKVSCEATVNFKESLRHSFNDGMKAMESSKHLVSSATAKMTNEMVFCISLLHTVLSQRRRFTRIGFSQDYFWSHNELMTSLDMLRALQPLDIYSGLNNLQDVLGSVVYGGCVLDMEDLKVVQAIVDSLIVNWQDVQQMPSSMGVSSLLASLQPVSQSQGRRSRVSSGYTRRLQRVFDTMKDEVQPTQLGLMSGTPRLMETREGRYLSTALQKLEKGYTVNAVSPMQWTVSLLYSVQHRLEAIQPFEQPSSESLSYLETFLSSEISILNQTIQSVQSDVGLLLQSAQGSISLPPLVEDALLAISQDILPQSWLPSGHPECTGVLAWIERLKARGDLLERYVREGDRVVGFDLAVFSNPKMFLRSVLQEHARKEYIEVHRLQMETHVMDLPGPPTAPPDIGVYINGLLLHNAAWDSTRQLLSLPHIPDPSKMITDDPSPLPLTWFKPVVDLIRSQDKPQGCYRCPMYMQGSKVTTLRGIDLLTFVDLPSKLESSVWAQKRVFVTPP